MRRVVLWDLDGTLLRWTSPWVIPQIVVRRYLRYLREGYPWGGIRALWSYLGLMRSVDSDGLARTFERRVCARTGLSSEEFWSQEEAFCTQDLNFLSSWIEPLEPAQDLVRDLAARGIEQVGATNPNMLQAFQALRLAWAGYDLDSFTWITGLDVSPFLKPDPRYYQDILDRLGVQGKDCLMVGNDPKKDLAALEVGIPVFLLHDPMAPKVDARPPTVEGDFRALESCIERFIHGRKLA